VGFFGSERVGILHRVFSLLHEISYLWLMWCWDRMSFSCLWHCSGCFAWWCLLSQSSIQNVSFTCSNHACIRLKLYISGSQWWMVTPFVESHKNYSLMVLIIDTLGCKMAKKSRTSTPSFFLLFSFHKCYSRLLCPQNLNLGNSFILAELLSFLSATNNTKVL